MSLWLWCDAFLKMSRQAAFPTKLYGLIIFEDMLSNIIVIVYVALIWSQEGIIEQGFLLQEMVCRSAMKGTLRSISWENTRTPGLAFNVVEIVYLIEWIVLANPSSRRWRKSCCVWGGQDKIRSLTKSPLFGACVCILHLIEDFHLLWEHLW